MIIVSGSILARDTMALNKASKDLVQNLQKDKVIISGRIAQVDEALANNDYDKCIKLLQSGLIIKEIDASRDLIAQVAANKNLYWWEKKNIIDAALDNNRYVTNKALLNAYKDNDGHTLKLLEKKAKVKVSLAHKILYSGPHLLNGIRHKIF